MLIAFALIFLLAGCSGVPKLTDPIFSERGGFDLALIAIGAYEPRWFMSEQHLNPAESVQVHRDVGAKRSVGVHWGTFNLTDEPLDQPPRDLAAAREAATLPADDFFLLSVGETRKLPAR